MNERPKKSIGIVACHGLTSQQPLRDLTGVLIHLIKESVTIENGPCAPDQTRSRK
jgi:hypothetical protein